MSRKTRDTNIASIYFTQKRWTRLDTVAVIIISIGAAILIFWNGYGYIGIPILLIGSIIKIFSSNAKVHDSDYDDELKKLINSNYIETHRQINDNYTDVTKKITLCNYDISTAPIVLDKYHKARSRRYCIATFDFSKDGKCTLELCDIDVPDKTVSVSNYSLALPCDYEVIAHTSAVPSKQCASLKIEGVPEFPVDINSTDTDTVLHKLK